MRILTAVVLTAAVALIALAWTAPESVQFLVMRGS
jgi:hypothetical protein